MGDVNYLFEGLVRTGTVYAFMQWLGRSHVLFAIIAKIPEVLHSGLFIQMGPI